MAAARLNCALAWRNHNLESELRALKSAGERKEESWVRDYTDLFEMNQKQLDFTDEVLVQMSRKQREKEQVEQDVKALQVELRKTMQEREHLAQTVQELQLKMQKMEKESQEMKRSINGGLGAV